MEEQTDVLTRVLMGLFPGAPFDVDLLAAKILEALGSVGWSLSYDPEWTEKNIQQLVAATQAQHPTPGPFVPPQPPERLAVPPTND